MASQSENGSPSVDGPASIGAPEDEPTPPEEDDDPEELDEDATPEELVEDEAPDEPDEDVTDPEEPEDVPEPEEPEDATAPEDDPAPVVPGPGNSLPPHAPTDAVPMPRTTMTLKSFCVRLMATTSVPPGCGRRARDRSAEPPLTSVELTLQL